MLIMCIDVRIHASSFIMRKSLFLPTSSVWLSSLFANASVSQLTLATTSANYASNFFHDMHPLLSQPLSM